MFLRSFSIERPRWGWRRAAKAARRGWVVNDKRIQRLWRDEGLKVPYEKRKKRPRGIGATVETMCPIRPNALSALDFKFGTTSTAPSSSPTPSPTGTGSTDPTAPTATSPPVSSPEPWITRNQAGLAQRLDHSTGTSQPGEGERSCGLLARASPVGMAARRDGWVVNGKRIQGVAKRRTKATTSTQPSSTPDRHGAIGTVKSDDTAKPSSLKMRFEARKRPTRASLGTVHRSDQASTVELSRRAPHTAAPPTRMSARPRPT